MNTVFKYIDSTAQRYPQSIAIDDGNQVTYEDMREKYSRLATAIMDKYPQASNRAVAIFLPKTAEFVISMMGILATGNAYVPLDFGTPAKRLFAMLEKLDSLLVITNAQGKEILGDEYKGDVCEYDELIKGAADFEKIKAKTEQVLDTDPAYVMFTSGSTGVPKGVTISHRGIENYAMWLIDDFDISKDSVLGLQSGFHFDNSVFDIYTSFFTGAKLVIIPELLFMYPSQLVDYIREKRVSCVFWVPTVMISVANSGVLTGADLPDLKTITFAGEVMPNKQLNIWRRALPDAVYANLYGPTEITVDCTYYVVDREFADEEPLPIGYPVPNTKILILDEEGREAEPGEKGELCVIGCGVALGYWNDTETTQKAFVQNPTNTKYPEIMYKTGDLAYINEEGLIIYAGRKDFQIKLRGNRIEMGDIEAAAMCIDGVEEVCALFDAKNEKIVLVVESKEEFKLRTFNQMLSRSVPKYMLPGKLIVTDKIPLTPNNKVDRKRLMNEYVEI